MAKAWRRGGPWNWDPQGDLSPFESSSYNTQQAPRESCSPIVILLGVRSQRGARVRVFIVVT